MKNLLLKAVLVASFVTLAVTSSFAQTNTASASATATIITPLTIAKNTDMNFGNVAVTAVAGTVVLAPAGTRTVTGGASLPTTAGTVSAATFTVSGQGNSTYAITLPSTCTITRALGSETMDVNTFTSTPLAAAGQLNLGTQSISVGATLNVTGSQVPGTYTSGTSFDVTVNYN